jgi:hypothetical protein
MDRNGSWCRTKGAPGWWFCTFGATEEIKGEPLTYFKEKTFLIIEALWK